MNREAVWRNFISSNVQVLKQLARTIKQYKAMIAPTFPMLGIEDLGAAAHQEGNVVYIGFKIVFHDEETAKKFIEDIEKALQPKKKKSVTIQSVEEQKA